MRRACSPFVIVSPLQARKPKVESRLCHLCDGISQRSFGKHEDGHQRFARVAVIRRPLLLVPAISSPLTVTLTLHVVPAANGGFVASIDIDTVVPTTFPVTVPRWTAVPYLPERVEPVCEIVRSRWQAIALDGGSHSEPFHVPATSATDGAGAEAP